MTSRRARRLLPVAGLLGIMLTGGLLVAIWGGQSGKPTLNDRVRDVASQLRCPVCQGESVYDSPAGLAGAMRTIIRERLRAGETEAQVKSYFVSRYGAWILLAPPVAGVGILVWFGPPLLIIIGLLVLGVTAYAWRKSRRPAESPVGSTAADVAWAIERLDETLDDGALDAEGYRRERARLERAIPSGPPKPATDSRRVWLQVGIMISAALIIAASISLAVQQRGSAPITGSIPGSASPTPAPTLAVPADMKAALEAVAKHPHAAWAWTALGSRLMIHEQSGAASRAFETALRLDRLQQMARMDLAFLEIGQAKDAAAIRVLAPITGRDPRSPRLWLLEGLARGPLEGQSHAAIADFRRYLRLAPHGTLASSVEPWISDLARGRRAP